MKKDKLVMIWSARLLSLMMIAVIIVLGILTYGLADSGSKVKVDRDLDEKFVTEKAGLLSADWNNIENESEVITIPSGQNIFSYVSDEKEAEFGFWMVGAKMSARVDGETSVEMSVRVSADGENWSDWQVMEMEKLKNEEIKYVSENPILFDEKANFAQYKIILNSDVTGKSPEVYSVEMIYLNSEDQLAFVKKAWGWMVDRVVGGESVKIVTREDWGADESLMTWNEFEYAPVEQIIVHHTAGGNNEPSDPAAVVRGIYYFHAVEKEWGDIGYNYVIDHKGNVYEGRKGGLGVVGAHASGNNYGSVGISIIGNYSADSPSANALKSLIDMVEYVGYQTGIDVVGSHLFEGNNISIVAGHRDVNPTVCPGDVLYNMLSDVAKAAKQGASGLPERVFSGNLQTNSDVNVSINSNEVKSVEVKYKNIGTAVWLNQTDSVVLVPSDPYPRNSGFQASDWKSAQIVGPVSASTVMPGDEVNFKLNLKGLDNSGQYRESFALKGPGGILAGTSFTVVIENKLVVESEISEDQESDEIIVDEQEPEENVDAGNSDEENQNNESQNMVDPNLYHSAWSAQADNLTLYPGEEKTVWIDIKNTGKVPWYRDGEFPIRLGTSNPVDRHSGFKTESDRWLSDNRIEMVQWSVEPGEVARFRFGVKGVMEPGIYKEYFRPVVEGVNWLEDEGIYIEIKVEQSQYASSLVAMSERQVMLNQGDKMRLWVELKNTGNVVWRKDGDYPVRIGTDDELDRASNFYSPGFWISANRAGSMKKTMVYPGETVRFEIVVTAPDKSGVYNENFRPVVDNLQWMDDVGIDWQIVVR